jgi:hypothetical protein
METIRNFKWRDFWAPATFITVLGFAVAFGQYIQDIESRTLESVQMKVRLEDHMKIWTPEVQLTSFQRLAAVEDSTLRLSKQDSLAKLERDVIKTKLNLILQILKDK